MDQPFGNLSRKLIGRAVRAGKLRLREERRRAWPSGTDAPIQTCLAEPEAGPDA